MEALVRPEALRNRIVRWAEAQVEGKALTAKSSNGLEAVLDRGEFPQGAIDEILHTGVRQAQRIVAELVKAGDLVSDVTRSPLRIAFPATLAAEWIPGL